MTFLPHRPPPRSPPTSASRRRNPANRRFPTRAPPTLGAAMATALVAFFFVTARRRRGVPRAVRVRPGQRRREQIVHGAWWRSVTALTLHADLAHVLGHAWR